jgi:hypothetical protein
MLPFSDVEGEDQRLLNLDWRRVEHPCDTFSFNRNKHSQRRCDHLRACQRTMDSVVLHKTKLEEPSILLKLTQYTFAASQTSIGYDIEGP